MTNGQRPDGAPHGVPGDESLRERGTDATPGAAARPAREASTTDGNGSSGGSDAPNTAPDATSARQAGGGAVTSDAAMPTPVATPVLATSNATLATPASLFEQLDGIPARALTQVEATGLLQEMDRLGFLRVGRQVEIRGDATMPWGFRVSAFRVPVAASRTLVPFYFNSGDALDPRLAIMLWRCARALVNNPITVGSRSFAAIGLGHVGVYRPSDRPWLDSHNQGRAIDLTQIHYPLDAPTSSTRTRDGTTYSVVRVDRHWGALPLDISNESQARRYRSRPPRPRDVITGWSAITNYLEAIHRGARRPQSEVLLRLPRNRPIAFDVHVYRSLTQRPRPQPRVPTVATPGGHRSAVPAAPVAPPPPEDIYDIPDTGPANPHQRERWDALQVSVEFGRRALWVLLDTLYAQASLRAGGNHAFPVRTPGLDAGYALAYPTIPADDPTQWGNIVHPDDPGGRWMHNEHIHVECGTAGWSVPRRSSRNADERSGFQGRMARNAAEVRAAHANAMSTIASNARATTVARIEAQLRSAQRARDEAERAWRVAERRRREHHEDATDENGEPIGFADTPEARGLELRIAVAEGLRVEPLGAPPASAGQVDTLLRLHDADDATATAFVRGQLLGALAHVRVLRVDDYLAPDRGAAALRVDMQRVIDEARNRVLAGPTPPAGAHPAAVTGGHPTAVAPSAASGATAPAAAHPTGRGR